MAKIKQNIEDFVPDRRLVDERGPTAERAKNMRPSPLNLALRSGKIKSGQGLAAEKFYNHWHRGGLVDSIPTANLAREVFGGDGFNVMATTEKMAFHRDRYRKAREKILERLGALHFWTLEQIVCHEKTFTEVGMVFGHKNTTRAAQVAFEKLLPVLNLLCEEWGIGP